MAIARRFQLDFLPKELPEPKGWQLAACLHPAREVAGDFYDAFTLTQGRRVGIVVADVCDKGVGAALLAQARRLGQSRGWRRLEVTTPPLPQFDRTLAFYQREGFSISGGRKLKLELP